MEKKKKIKTEEINVEEKVELEELYNVTEAPKNHPANESGNMKIIMES